MNIIREYFESEFNSNRDIDAYNEKAFNTLMSGYKLNQAVFMNSINFKSLKFMNISEKLFNDYKILISTIDTDVVNATLHASSINSALILDNMYIIDPYYSVIKYFSPMAMKDVLILLLNLSRPYNIKDYKSDYAKIEKNNSKLEDINIPDIKKTIAMSTLTNLQFNNPGNVLDIPKPVLMPVTADLLNKIDINIFCNGNAIAKEKNIISNIAEIIDLSESYSNQIVTNIMEGFKRAEQIKSSDRELYDDFITYGNRFIVTTNKIITILLKYITYVYSLHINELYKKITSILSIFEKANALNSTNVLESGALISVISMEKDAVSYDLKLGKATAFSAIAHSIYMYHTALMNKRIVNDDDVYRINYDVKPYERVNLGLETIVNGFDMLLKFSDGFVDSYDNLAFRSGLLPNFSDKYEEAIDEFANPKIYNVSSDVEYQRLLCEIKDFGFNAEQIAHNCKLVSDLLDDLYEKYCKGVNTEFSQLYFIQEVKKLVEIKSIEFTTLLDDIAGALISRFCNLTGLCNNYLNSKIPDGSDNAATFETVDDYSIFSINMDNEIYNECNALRMIDLQKSVYMEAYLLNSGLNKLYLEDDNSTTNPTNVGNSGNNNNTNNTSNQNNNTNNNQNNNSNQNDSNKMTLSDNSNNKQEADSIKQKASTFTKDKLNSITNALNNFWDKIVQAFEQWTNRVGVADEKWIQKHTNYLSTRSYANVTLKITPYYNFGLDNIKSMINTADSNLNKLNADNMSKLEKEEDIYRTIFSTVSNAPFNDTSKLKEFIGNYLKVGNNIKLDDKGKLLRIDVANNDLKNLVVDNMIPFVSNFSANKRMIINLLTTLKEKVKEIISTYENRSTNVNVNNNVSNGTDHENALSMETKAKCLNSMIMDFAGKVMNAIRDTDVEYASALKLLAQSEKTVAANQSNNNTQQNNTDNNQNNNSNQDNTNNNNQQNSNNNQNQ